MPVFVPDDTGEARFSLSSVHLPALTRIPAGLLPESKYVGFEVGHVGLLLLLSL